MHVPYSWLCEYVPQAPSVDECVEVLTMSGTKVEAVAEFGVPGLANGNAAGYRVGRVLSYEQHPNADRLRLCRVDVGEGEPRQIVCGASNFAEGDTVAVVLPGSTLPGGHAIGTAKLRGVESHGMMLSERELELSTDHAGIMILPAAWAPGELLSERLPIGDTVIELELTPNRPDCLGVLGVARELAAAAGVALDDQTGDDVEPSADGDVSDHVTVQIEAPDLCSRYMARAFVDVQVGPSPAWMRARLAAAGMRSINNVVDVTNYVMLATGQPLHAFDADKVRGGTIIVRRAGDGEKVRTLDDVERSLTADMLSIADAEQTTVIAGIMGAADVEVGESTERIILEAAHFHGPTIQRTSMALGIRSESSARFEKGLDPHAPPAALRMASRLLVELCGAKLVPGTVDAVGPGGLAEPPTIDFPAELAPRVLGVEIAEAEQRGILERLGYENAGGQAWRVPHWRMLDTTRPIDLVEEIGRIHGTDRIPATMPSRRSGSGGGLSSVQRLQRLLEDTCVGLGLRETMTYTLVARGGNEQLGIPADRVVRATNPMTAEHAELRASMLPSLLEVAAHNRKVGMENVALFELGRTYEQVEPGHIGPDRLPRYAREQRTLALVATGELHGGRFDTTALWADLASMAGIVAALLDAGAIEGVLEPVDPALPWLHPGQAGQVVVTAPDGTTAVAGWVGTVHPTVSSRYDLRHDVVAAELDLDVLHAARPAVLRYSDVGQFPPVIQDIAVVLAADVLAARVVDVARSAAGDLLEHIEIFDRYEGEGIAGGHYSLALRMTFRAPDRTLTDDEVSGHREAVSTALTNQLGAVLRG